LVYWSPSSVVGSSSLNSPRVPLKAKLRLAFGTASLTMVICAPIGARVGVAVGVGVGGLGVLVCLGVLVGVGVR